MSVENRPAAAGGLTWREFGALALLWLIAITVLSRDLFNPSLGYPDADRLLMDGVFIHDFLRDLPLSNIYGYTIEYFGQYPALSIGYRPPFFPFVEALFNLALGINTWSSRLAIQAFALVGLSAWFFLLKRSFDLRTAFLGCLLFITLPFVAKWGWYTMGELPLVSMAMLTAYLFHRYLESRRARFLYATAISFVLTVWTKQTAFYLAVWFLAVLAFDRSLIATLRDRHTWMAAAIVILGLTPLALITLWLGEQNLAQSVGNAAAGETGDWARRVENLGRHWHNLSRYQLSGYALALAAVGLALSVYRRDPRARFFWLLILTTFLFFAYILNPNERYTIFWLPAFTLFAALPVYYLSRLHRHLGTLSTILVLALAGYQLYGIYDRAPNSASGYDRAARHVVDHSESPTVFVDAYNNGYFTYFVRQADIDRSMYVLRGDKLLSSSAISTTNRLEVHARSREDIKRIFDDYGVEYIVVEDRNYAELPIHAELRRFLEEGPFVRELRIPVEAVNRTPLEGVSLLVYRYLERRRPSSNELELRLPVVGKTIVVPLRTPDRGNEPIPLPAN